MQNFQLLVSTPRVRALELRLAGEIDMASVDPFRTAARAAVASGDYDCVVIDLLGVEFIDSTGLHVLAETERALSAAGRALTVVCDDPRIRKLFELTGLDEVLTVVASRDDAWAVPA